MSKFWLKRYEFENGVFWENYLEFGKIINKQKMNEAIRTIVEDVFDDMKSAELKHFPWN